MTYRALSGTGFRGIRARIGGGTGGDFAFQRVFIRARGPSRLLTPHLLPLDGEVVFLSGKGISHRRFGTHI